MRIIPGQAVAGQAIPASRGYLHLGIVYVVWGSVYLAAKIAVTQPGGFPVFELQAIRLLAGGAILGGLAALAAGFRGITRRDLVVCAACGLMLWIGGNGLAVIALQDLPSGFVAMGVGTVPLWTAGGQAIIERRLPDPLRVIALTLGFAGLGLIIGPVLRLAGASAVGGPPLTAILALLMAPVLWVAGSMLQAMRPVRLDTMATASLQLTFGGLGALVLMLLPATGDVSAGPFRTDSVVALGYLAFVASAFSFRSYVIAVRSLPPHIVATFAYVNPVIGIVLGWLVLGEEPSTTALAGMGVVIASVGLLLRQKRS